MKNRSRAHILIVEDTEENIDILMETLADDFSISVALNGLMALGNTFRFYLLIKKATEKNT